MPGINNDFRKLGLDIRVINALAAEGILALRDLSQVSERDLASIRGVGPGTSRLLKDYLRKEHGSNGTVLVSVTLSAELLRAVDTWGPVRDPLASRSDKIRRLLEMALAASESPTPVPAMSD